MYDVIYFNVWSDIICTAAKLLHGTSAYSHSFFFTMFCLLQEFIRQVRMVFFIKETMIGSLNLNNDKAGGENITGNELTSFK